MEAEVHNSIESRLSRLEHEREGRYGVPNRLNSLEHDVDMIKSKYHQRITDLELQKGQMKNELKSLREELKNLREGINKITLWFTSTIPSSEVVNSFEAGKLVGVDASAIRIAATKGELHGFRIGDFQRYLKSHVIALSKRLKEIEKEIN